MSKKGNKTFYYAVWKGYKEGIFNNWTETSESVIGFKGSKYKKHDCLANAEYSMRLAKKLNFKYHFELPTDHTPSPNDLSENIPVRTLISDDNSLSDSMEDIDSSYTDMDDSVTFRKLTLDEFEPRIAQGPSECDGTVSNQKQNVPVQSNVKNDHMSNNSDKNSKENKSCMNITNTKDMHKTENACNCSCKEEITQLVNEYIKSLSQLKSGNCSCKCISQDEFHDSIAKNIDEIKEDFKITLEEMRNEITSLKSKIKEIRQNSAIEIDNISSHIIHLKQTIEQLKESNKKNNLKKTKNKKRQKSLINVPAHTTSKTSQSDENSSSEDSKTNTFHLPSKSAINENDLPQSQRSFKYEIQFEENQSFDSDSSTDEEFFKLPFIPKRINTLIIGDSVVNGIYERKMTTNTNTCKVISISGLDKVSLSEYLYNSTKNDHITDLIIHVGINDTKKGHIISKSCWKRMIKLISSKFPNANICMSTILPHKEKHATINKCTDDSNDNLENVCFEMDIAMINNDKIFFTTANTVKTGWFRDNIHPNKRGTSGLAVLFKTYIGSQFPTEKGNNEFHNPNENQKHLHRQSQSDFSADTSNADTKHKNHSKFVPNNNSSSNFAKSWRTSEDGTSFHHHRPDSPEPYQIRDDDDRLYSEVLKTDNKSKKKNLSLSEYEKKILLTILGKML